MFCRRRCPFVADNRSPGCFINIVVTVDYNKQYFIFSRNSLAENVTHRSGEATVHQNLQSSHTLDDFKLTHKPETWTHPSLCSKPVMMLELSGLFM